MVNMIKAEMIRMIKSRSFWAAVLVFIAVFGLCIFVQEQTQASSQFDVSQDSAQIGLYIAVDSYLFSLNSLVISFGATFGMLVIGIYLSSFVGQEYNSGYIKHTASLPNGRIHLLLAKIALSALLSIFILCISYIVALVLGMVFIQGFQLEPFSVIAVTFFYLWLLITAAFSLIIFITTLFKNKVAGIILLFLVSSGALLPLIETILDLFHLKQLAKYTLSYQYATMLVFDPDHIAISNILVFLSAIILYIIFSLMILKRRDF